MEIMNDNDNKVLLLLDKDLKNNKVLVHPNINTRTISIEYEEHKYIEF